MYNNLIESLTTNNVSNNVSLGSVSTKNVRGSVPMNIIPVHSLSTGNVSDVIPVYSLSTDNDSDVIPIHSLSTDNDSDIIPVHSLSTGNVSDVIPVHSLSTDNVSDIIPVHSLSTGNVSDVIPVHSLSTDNDSNVIPVHSLLTDNDSDVIPVYSLSTDNDSDIIPIHSLPTDNDSDVIPVHSLSTDNVSDVVPVHSSSSIDVSGNDVAESTLVYSIDVHTINKKLFTNVNELKKYINEWNINSKENVVIYKSDSKKIRYKCIFGGVYNNRTQLNPEQRIRRTGTRLTNCPFRLTARSNNEGWLLVITNPYHNHSLDYNKYLFGSNQKLNEDQKDIVKMLSKSGCRPRRIGSVLQEQYPTCKISSRSVYNYKAKCIKDELNNKTPIEYLYDFLTETSEWFSKVKMDDKNQITHLYLSHLDMINKFRLHSNVVLGDCTYKTNKYNMPLLVLIGISCTNKTFIIALCFLKTEGENDYIWALNCFKSKLMEGQSISVFVTDKDKAFMNAISLVFPSTCHLLCIWHVNQNILAKCKPSFSDEKWKEFNKQWQNVVYSKSEYEFTREWEKLQNSWENQEKILKYIQDNWINVKEKWAYAWTRNVKHYGSSSTSRVEGTHASIKKFIEVSTLNLNTVFAQLNNVVLHQLKEDVLLIEKQKIIRPHLLQKYFFSETNNKISDFASFKVLDEFNMVKNYPSQIRSICCCSINNIFGLPCKHKIKDLLEGNPNAKLKMNLIDKQWWLHSPSQTGRVTTDSNPTESLVDKLHLLIEKLPTFHASQREYVEQFVDNCLEGNIPFIQQPSKIQSRGRPSSSTKRIPTAAEIVNPEPKKRKCGACGCLGHKRSTCTRNNS